MKGELLNWVSQTIETEYLVTGGFHAFLSDYFTCITLPTAEILNGKNGISGLWVLNEIFQKKYPENMKKIVGAVWKLPAK